MWIRSQNKSNLVTCNGFYYRSDSGNTKWHYIYGVITGEDDSGWHLGSYTSKDRCIEIINEIQSVVAQQEDMKVFPSQYSGARIDVYEMPKE